ncbi:glyoxylate reductase/hydroxypyruvate reductase-like isoform X3 [Diaphorina citri]|uniref:Glyoxylate reductase/hydroxypyruvate reductase n=1 Tax=Diaphorina citri TaxID=121845 RepID=A0A1S3CZV7_DIACI|nr:glyoxylate reductase/hydroxypyruvate reductase-like isoform X3 [Diaphorina citri]
MSKPKLFLTRDDYSRVPAFEILGEMFDIITYPASEGQIPRDIFIEKLRGCSALLCTSRDRVDKQVLDESGENLKVITTFSVGYDHLELHEIKARGIRVGSVGHISSDTVAEYNIGLAIAVSRRFQEGRKCITSGEWALKQTHIIGPNIMGLKGATVGIVGLGNIGLETAKLLKAFKVSKILYTSRRVKEEGTALGAQLVPLDTLCAESDFIFVTCALTKDTEQLIGRKQFSLMKPTAILVNTSRGGLLDQEALVEFLKDKKIGGAGLDVMIPEPLPADHPLVQLDNCVLTPHTSSATKAVRDEKSSTSAENIIRGYKGEPMIYEL